MKYKRFFEEFIVGTPPKQYIQDVHIYICNIKPTLSRVIGSDIDVYRIYLPSKALKHVYDKRTSTIVECIDYVYLTLSNPDKILKNDKEADFIFCKKLDFLNNKSLYCPVSVSVRNNKKVLSCNSIFVGKSAYSSNKKRPILWSGEDGVPPS